MPKNFTTLIVCSYCMARVMDAADALPERNPTRCNFIPALPGVAVHGAELPGPVRQRIICIPTPELSSV